MRCVACGEDNLGSARFCAGCGVSLESRTDAEGAAVPCAACGRENPASARFCSACSRPLQEPFTGGPAPAPAASQLEIQYTKFWTRALALIIDALVLIVVGLVLLRVTAGRSAIVQPLVNILYFVLFTGLRGQTPGKQLVGIRVITRGGEVPGIWRAVLREVIGKSISFIVILLGYIWVAFDARRQGWHDKIARTYVVKSR